MSAALNRVLEVIVVAAVIVLVWGGTRAAQWAASSPAQAADEQMLAAAWMGDVSRFNQALANGASVSARDDTGATALHYAAMSGQADLVRTLIALGADVNAVNPSAEVTPLLYAAMNDHDEVVDVLLRAGARPSPAALETAMRGHALRSARLLRQARDARRGGTARPQSCCVRRAATPASPSGGGR